MIYAFDDVVINEDCWQIYRGNELVKTPPQVLDVLIYLIRHRNRIVTRHELLEVFWPEIYVSDGTLSRCLSRVREAIGQPRAATTPVTTVKTKGYRFIGEVTVSGGADEQASGVGHAPNSGARTGLAETERRLVLVLARTLSLLKRRGEERSSISEPVPDIAMDDLRAAIDQIDHAEPAGTYPAVPFDSALWAAASEGRSRTDLANAPEPLGLSVQASAQAAFGFEHPTPQEDN